MKKIVLLLLLIILGAGFFWLGTTSPEIEPKTINESVDVSKFIE